MNRPAVFIPPTVPPASKVLGVMESLRAVRRNVLSIIPPIAYTQPIVSGKTGPARWHMVQGPEGIERIFRDNADNYPKSEVMVRMLRPAASESLFVAEGAEWLWQRRAIAPVFSARNVAALAPLMAATAQRASDELALHEEGPVPMVGTLLSATFSMICDVALSGRDHFDSDLYGASITRYMQTVGRASLLDFLRVPPWFPRPAELFGRGAVRTMHQMVTAAIDDRRRKGAGPVDDLLDHMMRAQDPETGRLMSDRQLVHNMQFFIVAGHETTALALSWALMLLANCPDLQDRAAGEAEAAFAAHPDKTDLAVRDMPFVSAVFQESLRLYPPVSFLARDALAPDQIYDREVRRRDTIFVNIYGLHRHRIYWDGPDEFRPERFLPEASEGRNRFLFVPFGAGPRICAGASFAMMQGTIILATLLRRFRFEPAGEAPRPVMHMTLRPDPDVYLALHER